MKTYTLKTKPQRNAQSLFMLERYDVSDYRWVMWGHTAYDTVVFGRNGYLQVRENCKNVICQWTYSGGDVFEFQDVSHSFKLFLIYLDQNLLVFLDEKSQEYLVLVATSSLKRIDFQTLEGIEHYLGQNAWKQPISSLNDSQNIVYHYVNDESDVATDDADDDDDEFSEYADLTKEEIIYDYLQRQEEEQAEEDYYLELMNQND